MFSSIAYILYTQFITSLWVPSKSKEYPSIIYHNKIRSLRQISSWIAAAAVDAIVVGAPWRRDCYPNVLISVSAFYPNTNNFRHHRQRCVFTSLLPQLQMSLPGAGDNVNQHDGDADNEHIKKIFTSSIPASTSRDEFHQQHYKVVIVGAGASGLQCCNTLINQYNMSVHAILLLEARSRIGGRIHTTFETANILNDASFTTSTTTFALDHGAAWVHGTGFEVETKVPETIKEELEPNNDDEDIDDDERSHAINPMMYLLEQHATKIRTVETFGPENDRILDTYEHRFLINPIVNGNPWMRPRSILHDDGQLGLYVAGEYMFGSVSVSNVTSDAESANNASNILRKAVQRHYNILRRVQNIGNDMYDNGHGLETTTTSLADTIQMAVTQMQEDPPYETDGATEPSKGSDEQKLIAAITPFYMLLLECWYGCEVAGMQLSEFIEDEARLLNFEDHTYHNQGDFIGPHCTLQNGMISVVQPLLLNGVNEQILCNEEVTKVRFVREKTKATTNNSSNTPATVSGDNTCISIETTSGLHVTTDTCVVTIPAGCLKDAVLSEEVFDGDIPLSPQKIETISLLQMGCYKKIFLTFDRIFWSKDPAFIGLVRHTNSSANDINEHTGSNERYYKTQSTHPLGNCILVDNLWARRGIASMEIVLFGLAGKWSIGKSDDELRDAILEFISDAMNISMIQLQEYCASCHVTRWEEDRYSRGAYSSTALGILPRHLEEFRRPEWDGRLVFSGEATISEYDGSVFAALYSGMNSAKSIHQYFSNDAQLPPE